MTKMQSDFRTGAVDALAARLRAAAVNGTGPVPDGAVPEVEDWLASDHGSGKAARAAGAEESYAALLRAVACINGHLSRGNGRAALEALEAGSFAGACETLRRLMAGLRADA
ncbi:hypothetical protein [Roseivivax sediminis]|uniref:Uncharacterized protein n=1 Tax=Roseivivax sediminis TaxID=936889 RepID=A0A1I2AXP2_9RHOB|nr:hypothetical protein [Roseivivax sediminis]SFE48529.1 hypothetical protein SAMN04515678_110103 [Roseivivax sediminis]